MSIAHNIKKLREQRALSVAHIAREVGVAESTYRDWENGRQIKGEPYIAMARLFEVTLSELFLGTAASPQGIKADIVIIEKILQDLKLKL